jgi:hypothetical protein
MTRKTRAFVLTISILQASLAHAMVNAEGQLFPGGLADAEGKRIVTLSPTGGIQAIDPETGTAFWTSEDASVPIGIVGAQVIGLLSRPNEGGLGVVQLDSSSGKAISPASALPVPDWTPVQLRLSSSQDGNFEISSSISMDKKLTVKWAGETHYGGGPAPNPCMIARSHHNGNGTYEVDLTTGKLTVVSSYESPPATCDPFSPKPPHGPPPSTLFMPPPPVGVPHPPQKERTIATAKLGGLKLEEVLVPGAYPFESTLVLRASDDVSRARRWEITLSQVFFEPPRP